MEGHSETGITIMYMAEGMDDGDIICQSKIPILDSDTASSIHDKLSILGRDLLLSVLPSILSGTNSRTKQDPSLVTYGFNIKPEDEKIDFSKTRREVFNKIRGLYSFPGAYCYLEEKRLKIWQAYESDNHFTDCIDGEITAIYKDGFGVKVSNGEIICTLVQMEGKSKTKASDFVNGIGKDNLVGKILS